jgi:hypothetical protein
MNGLWATWRGTCLVRRGFAFTAFALASASVSAVPSIDEDVPNRGVAQDNGLLFECRSQDWKKCNPGYAGEPAVQEGELSVVRQVLHPLVF